MSRATEAERDRTFSRLDELWTHRHLPELALAKEKYAILSDLHLGDGGEADDFRHNDDVLHRALEHYFEGGYTLVLLGDVEELWQFELSKIERRYRALIYDVIRRFEGDKRLLRVFGNHDFAWGSPVDPATAHKESRGADEGLKILDAEGKPRFLLVHGHQGTKDSDEGMWVSMYWVRAVWTLLEPALRRLKVWRNPSEAKSRGVMKEFEQVRYEWAQAQRCVLICGHTHRAVFGSQSHAEVLRSEIEALLEKLRSRPGDADALQWRRELGSKKAELRDEKRKGRDIAIATRPKPCYFNTGCGLYTDGITAIELDEHGIALVKWQRTESRPHRLDWKPVADVLAQVGS